MPSLRIGRLPENFPILREFMEAVSAAGGGSTLTSRLRDVALEASWTADPGLKVATLAGQLMTLAQEHGAEFNQKDP